MSDMPAIRVSPAAESLYRELLSLRVHDDQRDFVGDIAVLLADALHCESSEPMAILRDGLPIGFYRIETRPYCIAGRHFDRPTLGLRSFFIDHNWQGQGLGGQALAAILDDLAVRHPEAQGLVLTVNVRNVAGLALYRRAGFEDTGELYHGGRSGPQYLMLRTLPA